MATAAEAAQGAGGLNLENKKSPKEYNNAAVQLISSINCLRKQQIHRDAEQQQQLHHKVGLYSSHTSGETCIERCHYDDALEMLRDALRSQIESENTQQNEGQQRSDVVVQDGVLLRLLPNKSSAGNNYNDSNSINQNDENVEWNDGDRDVNMDDDEIFVEELLEVDDDDDMVEDDDDDDSHNDDLTSLRRCVTPDPPTLVVTTKRADYTTRNTARMDRNTSPLNHSTSTTANAINTSNVGTSINNSLLYLYTKPFEVTDYVAIHYPNQVAAIIVFNLGLVHQIQDRYSLKAPLFYEIASSLLLSDLNEFNNYRNKDRNYNNNEYYKHQPTQNGIRNNDNDNSMSNSNQMSLLQLLHIALFNNYAIWCYESRIMNSNYRDNDGQNSQSRDDFSCATEKFDLCIERLLIVIDHATVSTSQVANAPNNQNNSQNSSDNMMVAEKSSRSNDGADNSHSLSIDSCIMDRVRSNLIIFCSSGDTE